MQSADLWFLYGAIQCRVSTRPHFATHLLLDLIEIASRINSGSGVRGISRWFGRSDKVITNRLARPGRRAIGNLENTRFPLTTPSSGDTLNRDYMPSVSSHELRKLELPMRAAVIEAPGKIVTTEFPTPEPGPQDVLIKVFASGICGTDVHIFDGDYVGSYPIIPGHEFSGIVDAVGGEVRRFRRGDRVAVEPNIACDNCAACLNNRQNFCENWQAVGVTRPGGMAEYVVAPEKAVFDIGPLSFSQGAFVEPLACVLHGVERTHFQLADRVLIIGAGPIGNLLTRTIRLRGACAITQVDRNQARLKLAREAGATETAVSLDGLPVDCYDVVVDATGVPELMQKTLSFARLGGTVLLFGVPPQTSTLTVDAFPIFRKGLTIHSSFTSVRNSLQAVRLLAGGAIDVTSLVSHTLALDDLALGIDLMQTGRDGVLKVLIAPGGDGVRQTTDVSAAISERRR